MVSKISNYINVSVLRSNGWVKSSFVLLVFGGIARIMALIKEGFVSFHFGVGSDLDFFYQSILIPIFLANMFGSPIAQIVIPELQRLDQEGSRIFIGSFLRFLVNLLVIIVPVAGLLSWMYLSQVNPSKEIFENVELIVIVLFLSLIVLVQGINSFLLAIAEFRKKFYLTHFHSVWLSMAVIFAMYFFGDLVSLIWAFFISYILFLLMQLVLLNKEFILVKPIYSADKLSTKIKNNYLLVVIAGGLGGSAFFVDQIMAATLQKGGISALQYAFKVITVFTGIAAISFGNVLLPIFAEYNSRTNKKDMSFLLRSSFKKIILMTVPFAILLFVFGELGIQWLYQRGNFVASDTELVFEIFRGYTLYFPLYVLYYVLIRYLSSTNEYKKLLYLSVFSIFSNITLNLALIEFYGLSGIVYSTVISSGLTLALGFYFIRGNLTLKI
jgi:putative peptidoglycan lipid II flippase